MSEQLTIKNLYNHMDETIAKDIFEGATYPWEILPKISGFIKELGKTLPADEYDQVGEDYGSPNPQPYSRQPTSTDRRSSERTQKSASAHLSAEMRSSAKVQS